MVQPICITCYKKIKRPICKNNKPEENYRFLSRKFCDITCQRNYLKKNKMSFKDYGKDRTLSRRTYAVKANKFIKNKCERCNKNKNLTIHHINRHWWDNDEKNLMTLCRSCHAKEHHKAGDIIIPIGKRLPCRICKEEYKPGFSRKDLCNKHRLIIKRNKNITE